MTLETRMCTNPHSREYDCLRVHPEMYNVDNTLVMLQVEEVDFLRSRGFEVLIDPRTVIDCSHLRGKVPSPYHVLLGQRSESMGEGELCVVLGNGISQLHTSHWHPSGTSKEKLARQIELDVLVTVKYALEQEGSVQLLVSDSSWMPTVDVLQSKYGVFPRFMAVEERRGDW